MKNFAVLASGYGGNLQAIIDAVKKKKVKADLKLVISDKADAYALVRAKKAKMATLFIDPKDFDTSPDSIVGARENFDRRVIEHLKTAGIDFVVLAGYMRLLSPYFIQQYPHKIINIHPALLPSFKGMHGIREAFEYGVKVTGVSVHVVTDDMDAGPILAQEPVKITAKDTLESLTEKIHSLEHRLYPRVIDWFAESLSRPKSPSRR